MSIFSIFCCVVSIRHCIFFAVMSHLTKFAWFYFPFHSICSGRGFKLIRKKNPCFINVCKTNAFPNNCAAALIDKQTDIQFAIMAVFFFILYSNWVVIFHSFHFWHLICIYFIYVHHLCWTFVCVCVFQYSSFDDEKNYICF